MQFSLRASWRVRAGILAGALATGLLLGSGSTHAQDETATTSQIGQDPGAPISAYCQQLERQLGKDWQQALSARDALPKIQAQMARTDQLYQRSQSIAEHSDCFDYFLFSKTWRDTPQCRQLHQQIGDAQRSLTELERQRQAAGSAQDRSSRQDAVLAELARNKCGPQYEAAMQRRGGGQGVGVWNDSEAQAPVGGFPGYDNAVPGSTFRTICVRMCDGYYFPISFATTQDQLEHDSQACQSQCGSPAKLYYYPNPGGEVQQSIALDGTAYAALHNAFRYRKELVSSCTCKGPAGGPETVADTQPMQSPLDAAAPTGMSNSVTQSGSEPLGGTDSLAGFGSLDVQPEGGLPLGKRRPKRADPLGVSLSKH